MGYTTERLNNRKFLVAEQEPDASQNYQLQMLSHNTIGPLLEFSVRAVDSSSYYYYDVTGLRSLAVLGGDTEFGPEAVVTLCQALAELDRQLNEYLLDIDRTRVVPDYVYSTPALDRFRFLYDPDRSVTEDLYSEELRKLFEFVLQHFDHTADRDETVMVYDIYSHVLKGTFDAAACSRICGARQEERAAQEQRQEPEMPVQSTGKSGTSDGPEKPGERKAEEQHAKKIPLVIAALFSGLLSAGSAGLLMYPGFLPFERNSFALLAVCTLSAVSAAALAKASGRTSRKVKAGHLEKLKIERISPDEAGNREGIQGELKNSRSARTDDAGERTERIPRESSGEDSERALFDDATSPLPAAWNEGDDGNPGIYLDDGAGSVFEIESFPFIVGTSPVCDARLSDRTVSRRHLRLFRIGENIAVADMGSTNGTAVNGKRLGAGENRKLEDGDVLGLGRERLTVHILG